MPGISYGKAFENSQTTGISWRDGLVALVSTTLYKNPLHPRPNNLWAFIAVISFTLRFENFLLCTTFSPLGPLE